MPAVNKRNAASGAKGTTTDLLIELSLMVYQSSQYSEFALYLDSTYCLRKVKVKRKQIQIGRG
jgi:hypothetical protein